MLLWASALPDDAPRCWLLLLVTDSCALLDVIPEPLPNRPAPLLLEVNWLQVLQVVVDNLVDSFRWDIEIARLEDRGDYKVGGGKLADGDISIHPKLRCMDFNSKTA